MANKSNDELKLFTSKYLMKLLLLSRETSKVINHTSRLSKVQCISCKCVYVLRHGFLYDLDFLGDTEDYFKHYRELFGSQKRLSFFCDRMGSDDVRSTAIYNDFTIRHSHANVKRRLYIRVPVIMEETVM